MGIAPEHEIHQRRFSRNLGVGAVLGGFVILVFALTLAKLTRGDPLEGYDHQIRADQLEASE